MKTFVTKFKSKTRLFAGIAAFVTVAQSQGLVQLTPDQLQLIQALCASGVAWGLRDAVDGK